MKIHKFNKKMLPDSEFISGSVKYLVVGNKCRLLDCRRTPGIIEDYFENTAMFRWRITDFEDKGKYWDIPAEDIIKYQLVKDAKFLNNSDIIKINNTVSNFQKILSIKTTKKDFNRTFSQICKAKDKIKIWLHKNKFPIDEVRRDYDNNYSSTVLCRFLQDHLKAQKIIELEDSTSEIIVLNPSSGEWIKGMRIVLAEMGLVDFKDKIPRTDDIFLGIGNKDLRYKYIIHRLAFLRAYFELLDINEVVLYRGMSFENYQTKSKSKSLVSFTFSKEVAESFTDFNNTRSSKNSYLIKRTIPVDNLFMTFLETKAMNRQYKEVEAIIFCTENDKSLW